MNDIADEQAPSWDEFHYTSRDGLRLAGRKYGWENVDSSPVVCIPGLTRTTEDFHELANFLSTNEQNPRRVLTLDLRGRGSSAYDKNWGNYNLVVEADDVVNGIVAAGLEHVDFIGTSRGGLIALLLASSKPTLFRSLILNDIGPVMDGKGLVRIRAYLQRLKVPSSYEAAAEALKMVGSSYFPARTDNDWLIEAKRVYRQVDGKLKHQFDLKLVDTLKTINLDQPLIALWPQFEALKHVPTLVLHGQNSDLLSAETVSEMERRHPDFRKIEVLDQGHAPDLGSPGLPEAIAKFHGSIR